MRIELLYVDGCPGYEAVLARLHEIVSELDVQADIESRPVDTLDEAAQERFLGSPSVRIDGRDIDPAATGRTDYGVKCRLYRSEGGASGVPPDRWIREAVTTALSSS